MPHSRTTLLCDWAANAGNPKGRLVLLLFRVAHLAAGFRAWRSPVWFLLLPHLLFYRFCIEWCLGIELPYKTRVGPGLRLFHGCALVVNDACVIGAGVTLRHSTTLGHKTAGGPCPVLGDGVDVGSNVVIIGPVSISAGSVIGAGSVVLHSVDSPSLIAGNPARVLRTLSPAADGGTAAAPAGGARA